MNARRDRGQGGFTLIEVLTVVVIIGVLAAIAIPQFAKQRGKADAAEAKSNVRNAAGQIESAAVAKNGNYSLLTLADIQAEDAQIGSKISTITFGANDFCAIGIAVKTRQFRFHKRSSPQLLESGTCPALVP